VKLAGIVEQNDTIVSIITVTLNNASV